MKDIPGMVLILGGFFFFAIVLFIYASSGPKALPEVENPWSLVENVREDINYRRLDVKPGEPYVLKTPVYKLTVNRTKPEHLNEAHYYIKVRPVRQKSKLVRLMAEGVDVGLVDKRPSGAIGEIEAVHAQKVENNLEEAGL